MSVSDANARRTPSRYTRTIASPTLIVTVESLREGTSESPSEIGASL